MDSAARRGGLQTTALATVCAGGAAVNVAVAILCLGMGGPLLHGAQLAVSVLICYFLHRGAWWARWIVVGTGGAVGLLGVPVGALLFVAGHPMGAYVLTAGLVYTACAVLLLALPDVRAFFRARREGA